MVLNKAGCCALEGSVGQSAAAHDVCQACRPFLGPVHGIHAPQQPDLALLVGGGWREASEVHKVQIDAFVARQDASHCHRYELTPSYF